MDRHTGDGRWELRCSSRRTAPIPAWRLQNPAGIGHNDDEYDPLLNSLQIFDVKYQTIESIQLDNGTHLHYTIDSDVANFGKKLTIFYPSSNDRQQGDQ